MQIHRALRAVIGAGLIAYPGAVTAQQTTWLPAVRDACPRIWRDSTDRFDALANCAFASFTDTPIHALMQSIAPLSGIGLGAVYHREQMAARYQNQLYANVVATFGRSWSATLRYRVSLPAVCDSDGCPVDRPLLQIGASYRDLHTLNFFGLGPNSSTDAFQFGLKEGRIGFSAAVPIRTWFVLLGSVDFLEPRVERGGTASPVIGNFDEASAPGVSRQTAFIKSGAGVNLRFGETDSLHIALNYSHSADLHGAHYSFNQFSAAPKWDWVLHFACDPAVPEKAVPTSQQQMASRPDPSCERGTLGVGGKLVISSPESGAAVPFFYQPSLGGTDIDGFDTLRGFRDYRFRGADALLFQAQYTRTLRLLFGFGVLAFADAGQVATHVSGFRWSSFRFDYGPGVTFSLGRIEVARLYLGLGGGEGTHVGFEFSRAASLSQ